MGRFSHRSLQLGRDKRHKPIYKERCNRRRARPEKWPDLGPADCGSKFLSHREATNLIRLNQPTGSTPQEVGLPRRFTSRLRRSHRGHILGGARMLSIRFFRRTPNFFAIGWHAKAGNDDVKGTCGVSHINEKAATICHAALHSQPDSGSRV